MTPKQELDLILKKQEIVTATIATDLVGELVNTSPVGSPQTWKNPDSAPSGYTGGNLRRNWTIAKTGNVWEINNNAQYAERRLMPLSPDGYYGSKQFPAGAQPIIDKYDRKLQSELNKI